MKGIIDWTLKSRRSSIWWWCLGIATFVALELSVYPSVKSQAKQLNQLLDKLPSTVRHLFGANDLFSPTGYLNSRLFYLLLPLFLSILAIGLGSTLIAKEEADGTIELLLARQLSRARLIAFKLIGGFITIAAVSVVSAISILIAVKAVNMDISPGRILLATLMAALISILFGMIAFAITCISGRGRGAAIGIASLVGLGGYIVTSLEGDVQWLKWPAKIFPYHYYSPADILNGHFSWVTAAWFTVVIIALAVISWRTFDRRDVGI